MTKTTLNAFYNQYLKESGLIPNIPAFAVYPVLEDYFKNQKAFDSALLLKHGELIMASDDYNTIINSINALVAQLAPYKWEKLKETITIEYNPVWNVDGTEVTEYGERVVTDVHGMKHTTLQNGNRQNETDSYVVPYDSTLEAKVGKDVSTSNQSVDDRTEDEFTDTNTHGQHKDTLTRQGNIGVTSTQNLLQQERDIVNFNLYAQILEDVVNSITIPYYDTDTDIEIPCWFWRWWGLC